MNLTWEVTLLCNLRCRHCLSSSAVPAKDEMTTAEALDLVDQLSRERVFQINFGGGEPFMRPDFLQIIDACHVKGIMTCISTNGTLINQELVDYLSRTRLVAIQVSLDGARSETCDEIRGKGTYGAAIQALKLLAKTRIPTSINTVLTAKNAGEVEELQRLADEIGVSLRISRFRPSGRGAQTYEELKPTPAQLLDFSAWLGRNDNIRTGDSFFSLSPQERQGLGLNLCGACKLTCCVGPTGKMYPCAFLQSERFEAGDLRRNSFKEIWDNSEIYNDFRQLRVYSCEGCDRFDLCHGGCPAVAYYLKGDIAGGDPECLQQCVTALADMKERAGAV
ncbi:mycofactocin radical SAM maturase [Desulfuromonas thiophila]|uniref:mycofactocin radical SAM maturase n=1 Tax=Desulfuromonas thiophila TaxID=57664 RepID=UPI0029F4E44B|nr:mycofactocin radical SAM maturase [Desulfuromonas thiophila]